MSKLPIYKGHKEGAILFFCDGEINTISVNHSFYNNHAWKYSTKSIDMDVSSAVFEPNCKFNAYDARSFNNEEEFTVWLGKAVLEHSIKCLTTVGLNNEALVLQQKLKDIK